MKNKSLFSILFDIGILIVLAVGSIYYINKLQNAKEEIELIRNGFMSVVCLISLGATCVMQRMEQLLDK